MARDLRPLFDPRSVAIVGASDDPAKWGNWLGRGALKGEHRRPVYLINRNGGIGLGSQSGNLALELGILARDADLGFSRFASIGNQADVDLAELIQSFSQHAATEVIAVYAEDFRDGRAFVDAAAAASKPVVLLTVGRSQASVRAAASHTGALVSDMTVVEAACGAAGAHLVATPAQMIDVAQALLTPR